MNMVYNASAGTGKTWQVTELYSALVLGSPHDQLPANRPPVDSRRILLMTFTDNAAAELRRRVAERMISARGSDCMEQADCARRVLRSLPAAHISTIHAFCAGLLREHALDGGLSPGFQMLEDEARDAVLEETLKAEIFQRLETDSDFREFCSGISVLGEGDYSLIGTIRALLEKADSRGLDLRCAETLLPAPSIPDTEKIQPICAELRHLIDSRSSIPSTLEPIVQWVEKWEKRFPDSGSLDEFATDLDRFGKFGRVKGCKEISAALDAAKEEWKTAFFYQKNISQFRAFARCLAGAAEGFVAAKRARDVVDFGDQLLLARDVLRGGKFKELFDWIIVDEVQDTSRVQCELIEALWGPNTQLVICGDRKQSIYAWRSADPEVMPDLKAEMATRGGLRSIPLKKSYRSKDRVLEAVNELFSGIYADYETAALEPVEKINAWTAPQGEGPCVEFLMPEPEEEGSEEEMAAVARRIRLLVDGADEWHPKFRHNGEKFTAGEPFRYGDVLILLKRSTHQALLEKALRAAGIPYTSGGKGRGLFERQEVRDILLFLQLITQPFNDLALVGFLRSPFANVPDETIIELGWDGETFHHETVRTRFFESGLDAAERIVRFRQRVGKTRPSQLVREMVRETGFDAFWAGQRAGKQHLANVKKALDWIRGVERGGQVLIGDVVRRFEKAIQTPPRSGAAEALLPDPEQNAVTLMTVHAAKGLTKRVCIVPDISFGEPPETGVAMLSPEGRLEMSLTGLAGEKVKSPGWDKAREADKAVRKLEQDNVFYVAMTRARDLVVLSGAGTKKPDGWLKQAGSFLESASDDILKKRRFSDIPERKEPGAEEGGPREDFKFQPLEIPKGIDRKPVTALCKKNSLLSNHQPASRNSTRYGTLGHAVLEELARNGWEGDIPVRVERFRAEIGSVETEHLTEQLEAARNVLREETTGAETLLAEHPFVLKRGNVILDGAIDLLVQTPAGWKIFDYKFTSEAPESALESYAPQLAAYQEAVEKMNPGAEVSTALVLIGEEVQIIFSNV